MYNLKYNQQQSTDNQQLITINLFFLEHPFQSAAHWADPGVGQVFKGCTGRDKIVLVATGGIVDISANLADECVHVFSFDGEYGFDQFFRVQPVG